MAAKTSANCSSYFFSSASTLRARSRLVPHQAAELYEGAHDRDIDFHRPSAAQHTRKYGDPCSVKA